MFKALITPKIISTAKNGSIEELTLLLNQGVDVNQTDKDGKTALMFAAKRGSSEIVLLLLEKGANVHYTDPTGISALKIAKDMLNHEQLVAVILKYGCSESDLSCLVNHAKLLRIALEYNIFNKSHCDSSGKPLYSHLPADSLATVDQFFQDGKTALIYASEKGSLELVSLCFKNGANPNEKGNDGKTALMYAAENGSMEVFSLLLEKGANPRDVNSERKTALIYAAEKGFIDIASVLLKYGCSESDWAVLVQKSECIPLIQIAFENNYYKDSLCDSSGRPIYDIALPEIRELIDKFTLWFGRFKLLEERPEHQSATCYVFKALDREAKEGDQRVALKLMMRKDQFLREIQMRSLGFDTSHVIGINSHLPSNLSEEYLSTLPNQILPPDSGLPSKSFVEGLFAITLPLADRNLFVASKQERFAGRDWNLVKSICKQLVEAVVHVHSKGIIHADLKPLNIVRVDGDWKLIDFDASCRIGIDHTGLKSSSAFSPPESILVDRSSFPPSAFVRSEEHRRESGLGYDLLLAHPSFDVWGLGCIFYILCTDCRMLFQGGQDDNLRADENADSLFDLVNWFEATKTQKLSVVQDDLARNLLCQILMKDPTKRLAVDRILVHPFFTGKKVARMVGEEPAYDVFLSYRVWSDKDHVKKLHDDLTSQGLKVYWDAKCLEDGQNWEEGFCSGVLNCRYFLPVLSKKGLGNFANLTTSSPCDNVLLEHRLALELKEMGLIEGIFPIVIGNEVEGSEPLQMRISWSGPECWIPECRDECVALVERGACHHLSNQSLGSPLHPNRTVLSVMTEMKKMQGALIEGGYEEKVHSAVERIVSMCSKMSPSHPEEMKSVDVVPREAYDSLQRLNELKSQTIDTLYASFDKVMRGEQTMEDLQTSIQNLQVHGK